jgi:hypothetical protein
MAYHLSLDKRLEGVDLLIALPLHEFDFTECTLANDLECCVVLGPLGSSEETKEVCLLLLGIVLLLFFAGIGKLVAQLDTIHLLSSAERQYAKQPGQGLEDHVFLPFVASLRALNVLLEELSSQQLLVSHTLGDRGRVFLRVLRRHLVVVDARLLRLTWHWCVQVGGVRLAAVSCCAWAAIGWGCVASVRASGARGVTAKVHLLRKAIGDLVESRARRAVCVVGSVIGSGWSGARRLDLSLTLTLLELIAVGVEVVEVSLRVQAWLLRRLCAPNLLLASGIGKGLWEGRRRGRELTSLFGGEGLRVVLEAEVELESVRVANISLLLLLLLLLLVVVRHGGGNAISCECWVSLEDDDWKAGTCAVMYLGGLPSGRSEGYLPHRGRYCRTVGRCKLCEVK